jgi:dienelactone hydrolase
LPDDKAVLIYDQNDIWKLDPSGNTAPVNLTHGYGLKNHVIFKLAIESDNDSISLKDNSLLLSAFNVENKNSGFYTINLYGGKDPKECCMGPYIYKQSTPFMPGMDEIIKARNKNIYIVQRMSAKEPANYFYTTDFKNFTRITNFNLEKEYNWYTTELLSWKSLDGRKLQGILYKPENFDANKKYPVIFYCYERLSDRLNAYLEPEYSQGSMDIATYVSNGYLVFTPDIYYRIGDPLQGSYDAVVSAAQYVSTFPFVNSKKMGLQGHSFGAIQINYLITHTSLFAAACSASGISNFVSGYGSLEGNSFEGYNGGLAGLYETGQNRMGSTLWGNLKGYVKNSSIFQVDKVTTPLLMMHTKKDEICPYANAMEFFLGLRRLGKKVWMLVYPEGKHSVLGKESEDFTIRMQQFFDYYLKDKPAPIWMLEGTKEKDTGIKYALDLDVLGRTPGPSLLTPEEEKKVDNLMTREAITITIR